ncbi:MAG: GNAT family N-acetyltransferase [Rhizobacter sp.]
MSFALQSSFSSTEIANRFTWDNGRGVRCGSEPGDDPGVTRFNCEAYRLNGEVVGTSTGLQEGNRSHLNWIKVDDDKQGAGAGTALLDGTVEYVRNQGARSMTLRSNDDVFGWYGLRGFEKQSGVDSYGEDMVEFNMRSKRILFP